MYKDRFTGLYHTHFREYDPIHGRWLSEDPAGYRDGLNLYAAYMGVNGIDPLGLGLLSLIFGQGYSGEEADAFELSLGKSMLGLGAEMSDGLDVIAEEGVEESRQMLIKQTAKGYTNRILMHQATNGGDLDAAINSASGGKMVFWDFFGGTDFESGRIKIDLWTGRNLSDLESTQKMVMGGSTMLLNTAIGAGMYKSARLGYTGHGFEIFPEMARWATTFEHGGKSFSLIKMKPINAPVKSPLATRYGGRQLRYGPRKTSGMRARTGYKAPKKAVVIGEGMPRVKAAVRDLRAAGINARWYQSWGKYWGKNLTPAQFKANKLRNAKWMESKIKQGYDVYDIGPDGRVEPSPFYQEEHIMIDKHTYPTIPLGGY